MADLVALADKRDPVMSSHQIAMALGCGRNAIISKLNRIGHGWPHGERFSGGGNGNKPRKPRQSTRKIRVVSEQAKVLREFRDRPRNNGVPLAPLHERQVPNLTTEHKCMIGGLSNRSCRWPLWMDDDDERFYCGAPEADMSDGRSYCRWHEAFAKQGRLMEAAE